MNQIKQSESKQSKKHIRFDEDDSLDEETNMINLFKNDFNAKKIPQEIKTKTLSFNLVKNRLKKEISFGFRLQGDPQIPGEHYIDSIASESPSDRVGLRINDKIIKVNGINVENLNINNLFNLIEHETKLNDLKLNLVIIRKQTEEDNPLKRPIGKS